MMKPTRSDAVTFVSRLEALVRSDDRGSLAALRRTLARPLNEAPLAYPQLYALLPCRIRGTSDSEALHFLLAGLFARYYQGRRSLVSSGEASRNLGGSFRLLRAKAGDSAERRFVTLLNSHPDDLPAHLQRTVSLLRSETIPVNWTALLLDLHDWNDRDARPRRDWARVYWRTVETDGASGERAENIDDSANPSDDDWEDTETEGDLDVR